MIIAIITKYFPPRKGGIENHCYNLAKVLSKKGVRVVVHMYEYSSEVKRDYAKGEECFYFNGIPIIRHKSFLDILDIEKYDVIHLHNFDMFPHSIILFLALLKRKIFVNKGVKIIITLHGGYTPYWNSFPLFKRLLKMLYHVTLGKLFLNKVVNKVIAVSEYEKKLLIQKGIEKHKIIVIPNGIEDLAFTLPKLKSTWLEKYMPYLLFLGRVSREKNIEFIVKGLKYIDNVNLIVAGPIENKEYYNELLHLISKLELQDRVIFLNPVEGLKKYELIDNSLALVLTSNYESEGIVVKEAIARGKPVIVSNISPLKDIVKSNENGFVVRNYKEFINAVRQILNDTELIKKIYRNNKLKSRKWKWDIIANKVIEVYVK